MHCLCMNQPFLLRPYHLDFMLLKIPVLRNGSVSQTENDDSISNVEIVHVMAMNIDGDRQTDRQTDIFIVIDILHVNKRI